MERIKLKAGLIRHWANSSIVQDTVGTSYSIDLYSRDLITKSWRQRYNNKTNIIRSSLL